MPAFFCVRVCVSVVLSEVTSDSSGRRITECTKSHDRLLRRPPRRTPRNDCLCKSLRVRQLRAKQSQNSIM